MASRLCECDWRIYVFENNGLWRFWGRVQRLSGALKSVPSHCLHVVESKRNTPLHWHKKPPLNSYPTAEMLGASAVAPDNKQDEDLEMKDIAILAGATAIVAALTAPAFAQSEISTGADATGISAVNDKITNVEENVADDFARSNDAERFGPLHRRQGLYGSMALTYTGNSGNTEGQDLSVAGRINYNQGRFAQSVGLLLEYGEDDNGDKDKEEVFAIYDAQYYFNDRLYGFALGRLKTDSLATGEDLRRDGFLGFGPGYRIINTENTTWRVQAGVGVRYTQTANQKAADKSDTETGYIASSRFYHRLNETIYVTNDTDYLASDEAGETITNELGLNFKVTNALSTRMSYTTEYQSERETRTDNKVGISLVYGF